MWRMMIRKILNNIFLKLISLLMVLGNVGKMFLYLVIMVICVYLLLLFSILWVMRGFYFVKFIILLKISDCLWILSKGFKIFWKYWSIDYFLRLNFFFCLVMIILILLICRLLSVYGWIVLICDIWVWLCY